MDGPPGTAGGQEPATGAADQENQQDIAFGVEEQLVKQKLESALERLPLCNTMSIVYLPLNLAGEKESAHADAEIMKLVQESMEDEEGAAEEEVLVTHSKAEKLTGLSLTISLLELSKEFHRIAHRVLRRLQSDLRCTDSSTQTTLDS